LEREELRLKRVKEQEVELENEMSKTKAESKACKATLATLNDKISEERVAIEGDLATAGFILN
jgi:cell division protein FtsB